MVIPSYTVPLNGLRAGDGAFTADGRYFVNEWMGYISEVDPADGSGERLASNVLGGGMGAMVAVPEPGAIMLLAAGAVCLLLYRRRRAFLLYRLTPRADDVQGVGVKTVAVIRPSAPAGCRRSARARTVRRVRVRP